MLRWVPLSRSQAAAIKIAENLSFKFSLFVLVIELVPPGGDFLWIKEMLAPQRGYYRLRAQVHYRSQGVVELLRRHKLEKTELFRDAKGEGEAKKAVEATGKAVDEASLELMTIAWPILLGQEIMAQQRLDSIVTMTLKNLANGVEISGTFDEIRMARGALQDAVDKTHNRLLDALSFDQEDVIIIAPGKPGKDKKDKTNKPVEGS